MHQRRREPLQHLFAPADGGEHGETLRLKVQQPLDLGLLEVLQMFHHQTIRPLLAGIRPGGIVQIHRLKPGLQAAPGQSLIQLLPERWASEHEPQLGC